MSEEDIGHLEPTAEAAPDGATAEMRAKLEKQGPHRAPGGHIAGPWVCRMQFGEWYVRQDPANFAGMGYQHVCSVAASRKGTYYGDLFAATARLIASAPDMLEALQEADEALDRYEDITNSGAPNAAMNARMMVRAAIAKATGQ